MSTVKAKNIKVPNSAGTLEATLSFDGVNVVSDKPLQATVGALRLMTAVSATGTAVDFTGIPSWAKRITVMFNGVSTSGTSNPMLQIGSGSTQVSGYVGGSGTVRSSAVSSGANVAFSSGFQLVQEYAAAQTFYGDVVLKNMGGNIWLESGQVTTMDGTRVGLSNGRVTLSGTLDRIRITTANGVDTFDAGTINVMYEG